MKERNRDYYVKWKVYIINIFSKCNILIQYKRINHIENVVGFLVIGYLGYIQHNLNIFVEIIFTLKM